ncbi:rhodanese-like domain-containing protein [Planctomyces sp. SH-PL14]|uniref:rhodanese-like domain-containing protein n=1 Tax=Planctomyces sp. SH-PL14 TaxID=1632864 RepID=UPI00078D9CB1|nr:rhodanese-like domain-containing protein [Planctomyces sp. SH-PL14]AMV22525.1 molybdopterin biosynthesis protein MoeB [Planctomyces sp. SH-PL14]
MPDRMWNALTIAAVVIAANAGFAAEHTKDTLPQVKEALGNGKAVLVDVREKSEWNEGHLKQATLLPLSDLDSQIRSGAVAKSYAKDKVLYVHCAAGGRCLQAADSLKKAGYDVRPLAQGYDELVKNGFPVAK